MSDGLPVELPEVGRTVIAKIKHCTHNNEFTVEMFAVNESDCNWRFADDEAELSYDWDVVSWTYKSHNDVA